MQIELVSDKKGLGRFIRFPWAVYEGDPNWVPPLISEMKFLLGEENPFFHHAEAACFLATERGNVVGRVAAIIDRNHINTHNEQAGFFGSSSACLTLPLPGCSWTLLPHGSGNATSLSCAAPLTRPRTTSAGSCSKDSTRRR